jgi:hypothetical protein
MEAGGPPRPKESDRLTYAEVEVRGARGHLITTVHATPAGFRLRLLPGRYEFSVNDGSSAILECKPVTVHARAHSVTRVPVWTGCGES